MDEKPRGGRDWFFEEAGELLREMKPHLDTLGWYFTIGGSVATDGYGRDLDLIGVPVYADPWPREKVIAIFTRRWGEPIVEHTNSLHLYVQAVWRDEEGRLIDLILWRTVNEEFRTRTEHELRLEDAIAAGWGMGC